MTVLYGSLSVLFVCVCGCVGASSDLEKATTLATSMITRMGMNDKVIKIPLLCIIFLKCNALFLFPTFEGGRTRIEEVVAAPWCVVLARALVHATP